MIVWLALRNLLTHLRHSLVMAALIALLVMLFFGGNTVLAASAEGLRRTYARNYTGDAVVMERTDAPMSLFGAVTPAIGEFFTIPVLKDHDRILATVAGTPGAAVITSQLAGPVAVDLAGKRYPSYAFGIEAPGYFSAFPGLTVSEGRALGKGEWGAMITLAQAARLRENKALAIGDPVLLTVAGGTGFRIREVPLTGIFTYANPGHLPDEITLLDAQTLRALNAVLLAPDDDEPPPAAATDILTDDIDSLFGDADADTTAGNGDSVSIERMKEDLGRADNGTAGAVAGGSYNFIVIRLRDGLPAPDYIRRLNDSLRGTNAVAVDWVTAAGAPALLVSLLAWLFNAGLLLLMVAGVIAIINVLLISIFQRVREIGTLRAIGASNGFVRALILSENLIISFVAGVAGAAGGAAAVAVANAARIRVTNSLVTAMLGGEVVRIPFSPAVAGLSLAAAVVVGLLASLYPVQYALKIQPVEAVARG